MSYYFCVCWNGDLTRDPLDKGCEVFEHQSNAMDFFYSQKSIGYNVELYKMQLCASN